MKFIELQGELRTEVGKSKSKLARANGSIPCTMYGGEKNLNFTVSEIAFTKVFKTPEVYIVHIQLGKNMHKAIVKDIQFHPVTDRAIHVDFYEIAEDKPFSIKMPVKIVGDSEGVKQGGKLQVKMRKLKVKGLLKDIPSELTVDISSLKIGQSIRIPSLSYDNLIIEESKNAVVCSVNLTRSALRDLQGGGVEEKEESEGEKKEEE